MPVLCAVGSQAALQVLLLLRGMSPRGQLRPEEYQ
jgi:hypothetical protein